MIFESKLVRLPLRIGPTTLLRVGFSAQICRTHFTLLQAPLQLPQGAPELVLFSSIPESQLRSKLLCLKDRRLFYSPRRFPRYLTDLSSGFDAYLEGLGSKTRSGLRRRVKKFLDLAGQNAFRQYRTVEEVQEFHAIARELSRRTYQAKLMKTGLPDTDEFKNQMLELAADDQVRAYTLNVGARPVAYLYSSAQDGVLYYSFLGYHPAFASLSPGIVLQFLVFQELFNEHKFRVYDFEEGDGQHKRAFSTECTQCSSLQIFALSIKSVLFVLSDLLLLTLTRLLLLALDKSALRTKIRRLYRRI
jgi:hypothetical protein